MERSDLKRKIFEKSFFAEMLIPAEYALVFGSIGFSLSAITIGIAWPDLEAKAVLGASMCSGFLLALLSLKVSVDSPSSLFLWRFQKVDPTITTFEEWKVKKLNKQIELKDNKAERKLQSVMEVKQESDRMRTTVNQLRKTTEKEKLRKT